MKAAFAPLGFALGASAAALVPRDSCSFSLTSSGGESGSVGQLIDGQTRIAQTSGLAVTTSTFSLSNSAITDQNGRGCYLTSEAGQFQCDSGASPTTGFSVASNGTLEYNGNAQFWACATGDNGGYNIYTTAVEGQSECSTITLSTGGSCASSSASASASAPASSAPASSAPASSAPASSAPASSVPASSAPASSAPASSAPASSAPAASQITSRVTHTVYTTVSACGASSTAVFSSVPVVASSVPASSAPASSAPASSAPASSAPASSAPASSAPASSAPASSAPASSAPASSAPASSAPASSAPASSAPASSAPASSAPASSAPASSAPASSAPVTSAPASSTVATSASASASGSACQTSLSGAYQTPHAIIPINAQSPDTSYGTQYDAYISSGQNSTIFNFDIPQSYSGMQCTVLFLFPLKSQLETSDFTVSGSGGLTFSELSSAASTSVTYSSAPSVKQQLGEIDNVTPGNSYVVYSGSCAAGTTESIEVSATGSLNLEFFEDWNPSSLGVYITAC